MVWRRQLSCFIWPAYFVANELEAAAIVCWRATAKELEAAAILCWRAIANELEVPQL